MEKSSINASNVDSSQIHILSSPPRHIKGTDSKDFLSLPIPKKSAVVSPVTSDNTPAQSDFQVEVQDLLRVDKNSRTVLHRAALDQNVTVVKQLCERAHKVGIKDYVNKLDKFGNTSLMSACVENTNHLYSDKLECVKILLQYGADPNICNVNTLWTPLTWCAYYADAETTRELLNQGACPYYFDCLGYFPLDLCGLQEKEKYRVRTARILIEHIVRILEDYENKKHHETLVKSTYGDDIRFLKSPLLRTSVLYWVIYYQLDMKDYVMKLLDMEGVYPDFPLQSVFGRNCFHACCAGGNKAALLVLLDTEERYNKLYQKHVQEKNNSRYSESKAYIEKEEAEKMFSFMAEESKKKVYSKEFLKRIKEATQWVINFEQELERFSKEKKEMTRYFEVQDIFGNTPLHIASFLGKADIVQALLTYDTDTNIENKDGWRCIELRQYKSIEQLYKAHLKKKCDDAIFDLIKVNIFKKTANNSPSKLTLTPSSEPSSNKLAKLFSPTNAPLVAERKSKKRPIHEAKSQEELAKKSALFNEERFVPDVVLIFRIKSSDNKKHNMTDNSAINRINFNISLLKTSFDCYLATDVNETVYYLMIKMTEDDLDDECLSKKIKIKLMNSYDYQFYDPTRKVDFEPFRSRQRIEITQASLNDLIDIEQLKDLKILQDIYPMHTVSGIERIKEIWLNSKWYWPEPLASLGDYFKEGRSLNFTAITTLRMYFGERVSFYFAWTSFYTCYLLVLAIPGLIITILITSENEKILLPIWVIYNSLCSTLVVEKWKRKAAEIATRWGTLDMLESKAHRQVIRKEFIGNEVINETTGALTKQNLKAHAKVYFLLSAPILIILVAAVVGTFVLTHELQSEDDSVIKTLIISVINGIIIAVLNFLYQKIAHYFVNKENHKYTESFERSLIIKEFFTLFFNSYLGIYYLIFVQNIELYKLSYSLVSILITKQATSICTQCVLPWIQYKYQTTKYFKTIMKKGEEQWKLKKGSSQKRKSEDKNSDDTDYPYQRPVLNCRKGVPEGHQWDLTQVELNAMRSRNDDFHDDFGQMLIQYGYITIFASAFPIGPLISFIANIIDTRYKEGFLIIHQNRAKIYSFSRLYHRPPIEKAAGIGDWQIVWEVMSIIGLFTNALILFFRSEASAGFFEDALGDIVPGKNIYQDIRRLWVFLIVVYVILILKLLVRAFIYDKPQWVLEEIEKQKNEEKLALENSKKPQAKAGKDKGQTGQKSMVGDTDGTFLSTEPVAEQAGENSIAKSNQNIKAEKNKPAKKLVLQVQEPKEILVKAPKDTLPLSSTKLNINMGIKAILFNSFAHIEKELAFKRLELLSEQVDELALKCDGCKNEKAFLDCLDCREKYCQKCLKEIHNPTVRKSHQIISLIKPSYLNNKEKQLGIKSNNKNAQGWVKMECFAFPTFKQGDQYQNLEKAYRALYQIYIKNNGIAPDNKISDIEIALKSKAYIENNKGKSKLFFSKKNVQDKKEGNIAEKEGKDQTPTPLSIGGEDLGEIDGSLSEQIQLFLELSSFNTEEKILMNRIAFLVFKRRGAKAVYDDFYRQIKILQDGTFESKVMLLFDLIDQDSNGTVSIESISSLLNLSYLQNVEFDIQNESILKEAFGNQSFLNKKTALNTLIQDPKVKELLQAYLQIKNSNVNLGRTSAED